MNQIEFKEDVIPRIEAVTGLYEDAEWFAYTKDSARLKAALDNSLKVRTAWDNHKLVGLSRVVGDGHTIIYIQDILVLKEYQRQGIGSTLLTLILKEYKSIRQIVLMTDRTQETTNFYKKNGMVDTAEYSGVAFVKYNFT